ITFEQHCGSPTSTRVIAGTFAYRAAPPPDPAPWLVPNAGSGSSSGTPPTDRVTVYSDAHDLLFNGNERQYDSSNATIALSGTAADAKVTVSGRTVLDNFTFELEGAGGGALQAGGTYTQPGTGGIDIAGPWGPCGDATGQFEVRDIATAANG